MKEIRELNILMIGDIVGRSGREAAQKMLRKLLGQASVDLVVANGENAAGGRGLTEAVARELYQMGIDVITMGNHTWDQKDILQIIDSDPCLIRPANYPPAAPGKGYVIHETRNRRRAAVINLIGRAFMTPTDCPFITADKILRELPQDVKVILVDFHAEATSEKLAMGWFLDGRVSAVFGTHTHIQTADERILPKGAAYITDAGMTGPRDSILGVQPEIIITKFLTQMPARFELVRSGASQFNGVWTRVDDDTGQAAEITRINEWRQ
jgi:metallophosphoesterase (TIGR00282 family)